MELDKKTSTLWLVCVLVTMTAVLFTIAGPLPALEFGGISVLALVGWRGFSVEDPPTKYDAVPYYIIGIVVLLLLAIGRYASDHFVHLAQLSEGWFRPGLDANYTNWFLFFICLPGSFFLVGGYFLSKGTWVGRFFAWSGFLYFIAEALVQLRLEFGPGNAYKDPFFVNALLAILLFWIGTSGVLKLVKPAVLAPASPANPPLTARQINLWSLLFISLVLLYAVTLYEQAGFLPVGIIVGSMMGGIIGWRKTTARLPSDRYKLVPLYLLLQALFFIHVGEETLTHFNQAIAGISGHPWEDAKFNYLIALVGPAIWVFAGWSLWKGQPFGNFILWFLIVGMILGEPTHLLVFPVVRMIKEGVDYQYFPGMYTALFPMIPAILGLMMIVQDYKKHTKLQSK